MNNPVNMEDPSGNIAWWAVGAVIGAIAGGIAGAVYSYKKTGAVDWRYVAGGAVGGALIGAGAGYLAQAAYGAIVGAAATTGTIATEAAQRMENARILGQQGESAANIVKNTERIKSLTNTANYRIPDALNETTLTEIKNVRYQALTNQIKDFILWADKKGLDFVLKTRPDTKISAPLQKLINEGKIIHLFIGD
jgi:Restriction endonuclease fold toxin 7